MQNKDKKNRNHNQRQAGASQGKDAATPQPDQARPETENVATETVTDDNIQNRDATRQPDQAAAALPQPAETLAPAPAPTPMPQPAARKSIYQRTPSQQTANGIYGTLTVLGGMATAVLTKPEIYPADLEGLVSATVFGASAELIRRGGMWLPPALVADSVPEKLHSPIFAASLVTSAFFLKTLAPVAMDYAPKIVDYVEHVFTNTKNELTDRNVHSDKTIAYPGAKFSGPFLN